MEKSDVLKELLKNATSLTFSIAVSVAFDKGWDDSVKALEDTNKSIVELAKTLEK